MVSPPQNSSKMVTFINFFIGKPNFKLFLIKKVPIFTSQFWFIRAKIA